MTTTDTTEDARRVSRNLDAVVRCGLVHCESWAGHSAHKVTILRETKTRYVCRWDDLPAFRHATGDIIRPPKHAVEITPNARRVAEARQRR